MTATGHAVIGVVIAATVPNPVLAIPLALASHVAADLFPHWDPGTNRDKKTKDRFVGEAIADVILSLAVTFFLVVYLFPQTDLLYAYLIVFAAQFFDWASAPYLFFRIKHPSVFEWFYQLQKHFDNRLDKPWGIIGQIAVLVALVFFALENTTPTQAGANPISGNQSTCTKELKICPDGTSVGRNGPSCEFEKCPGSLY